MAIDTVCIRSPFIDENMALKIEQFCILRQSLEIKTGEVMSQITTGQLEGSYDTRISIRVFRDIWTYDGVTKKSECPPYIQLECSVHKIMIGHNIFGGPINFQLSCKWLIGMLSKIMLIDLPNALEWTVRKIDCAEVYKMESYEVCQEWFRGMNSADYPRRSVDRYGLSGLYSPGKSTTLKFYHKGPEFTKHDRKRLKGKLNDIDLDFLQQLANVIIRVEVSIKSKKLEYDFGRQLQVKDITEEYLKAVHDSEVKKMLREGASERRIVRQARSVENRLYSLHTDRMAGNLLGLWYRLSTVGEKAVKDTMTKGQKTTFYKYRKLLVDAGCSWTNTDVVLKGFSLVPEDFKPVRNDIRRLTEEHYLITQMLGAYRTA